MTSVRKRWTKSEDDFLVFAFKHGLTFDEMVEGLENRTKTAIKDRSVYIGLKRNLPPREVDGLYRCSKCKKYKSKEDFILLGNGTLYCYCNECKREISRQKYLEKKKSILELKAISKEKTKYEINNFKKLKLCSKCKNKKDVDLFHWAVTGEKLSSQCSFCKKESNIKYLQKSQRMKGY